MKFRTKSTTCKLLAGLTILMCSCRQKQAGIRLLQTKTLDFPSASALEFSQNNLYVFGDDAPYLLVLSPRYEVIDSIHFWAGTAGRIPKDEKHDIESAFFRQENGEFVLYGIGSMSAENRWQTIVYSLQDRSVKQLKLVDRSAVFPGVQQLNIEGSCVVANTLVLSNRANLSSLQNHLIVIEPNRLTSVKKINLPKHNIVAGVSGLAYVKEKDLLLLTASEEETSSAVLDGAIGDSYLGWVGNFSKKMQQQQIVPDTMVRLREIDQVFTQQKIESVCVESVKESRLILHLAADNDDGTSKLFKLQLDIKIP